MSPDKRRVILACGMSLDGYIARRDGSVDFLEIGLNPKDLHQVMADFYKRIDTIIMGRGTLEAMERMTAEETSADAPTGPWKSYVFSKTLPAGERRGMKVVRESPTRFIRRIRKEPGKHIFHMGGGQLARSFLEADLIDELFIGVVPVLIGEGMPLFPSGFPQREFRLVECQKFSRDQISLTYRRVRARPRKRKSRSR